MKIKIISKQKYPEWCPYGLEYTIEKEGYYNADQIGIAIGQITDKEAESYVEKDIQNNDTTIFNKIVKELETTSRIGYTAKDGGFTETEFYFLPYLVSDHTKYISTVTNTHLDGGCSAARDVKYEVCLVTEVGLTKYFTVKYKTKNINPFEHFKNIENIIEEYCDNEKCGFWKEDGYYSAWFFDSTGERIDVQVYSIDEFISMINSFRVICIETRLNK